MGGSQRQLGDKPGLSELSQEHRGAPRLLLRGPESATEQQVVLRSGYRDIHQPPFFGELVTLEGLLELSKGRNRLFSRRCTLPSKVGKASAISPEDVGQLAPTHPALLVFSRPWQFIVHDARNNHDVPFQAFGPVDRQDLNTAWLRRFWAGGQVVSRFRISEPLHKPRHGGIL